MANQREMLDKVDYTSKSCDLLNPSQKNSSSDGVDDTASIPNATENKKLQSASLSEGFIFPSFVVASSDVCEVAPSLSSTTENSLEFGIDELFETRGEVSCSVLGGRQ
jgi:hypothetical protein